MYIIHVPYSSLVDHTGESSHNSRVITNRGYSVEEPFRKSIDRVSNLTCSSEVMIGSAALDLPQSILRPHCISWSETSYDKVGRTHV